MSISPFLLLLLAFISAVTYSHECHHKDFQLPVQPIHIPEEELSDRRLQARQSIRIKAYYDIDSSTDETIKNTIQQQLVPAAISYYQAALTVDRLASPLSLTRQHLTSCSWGSSTPVPSDLQNGVDADLIILVTTTSSNQNFLAAASACLNLVPGSGRVVLGYIVFNTRIGWSSSSEAAYQSQVYTTIHEFGHVLGFASNLYQYYATPNPTTTVSVNGETITVLRMPVLRDRVRAHFGCNDLEGAYIENEGGGGSQGSHFERRVFFNEVMTSSITSDGRVSDIFLALLEGTGWYTSDYSMAEPMLWGFQIGCNFLRTKCTDNSGASNFPDYFCSTTQASSNPKTEACSFTGQGEGYCFGGDTFADGCPYYATYSNRNCRDTSAAIDASVGEATGDNSNCFSGSVAPSGMSAPTGNYCFKKTCESLGGGNYQLKIMVGSETVTCTSAGSKTLTGYSGSVTCPNPNTYCTTTGKQYCSMGCMGRGTCSNGVCQCNTDFSGTGCSYSAGFIEPEEDTKEGIAEEESSNTKFIIIGAVAGGVALIAAGGLCIMIKKKHASRRQRYIPNQNSAPRGDIRTNHVRADASNRV